MDFPVRLCSFIYKPLSLVLVTLSVSAVLQVQYPLTRLKRLHGSLSTFSEHDEVYYNAVADKVGNLSTREFLLSAFDVEVAPDPISAFSYPHKLTWFVASKIRRFSGISAPLFG